MVSMTTISSSVERLLESVGVGLWRWDGSTGRLLLDETCRKILDLHPGEEATRDYFASVMDEEELERYRLALNECLEHGSFFIEYRIRCRDRRYRFISGRGHALPTLPGRPPVVKGVFIDVTRNKELEKQLKTTESRMEHLADQIPGLFCYIDRNFRVQFMNARYRAMINASTKRVIGMHIAKLVGQKTFDERRARYEWAFAGDTVLYETSVRMPDGENRYFTIRHHPHRDGRGRVQGIMTLAMDITSRRVAEQALEDQSAELERSNRDLEQFAYVASHDLKAPLRSIEVLIEWLREDLEGYDEGEVQENLDLLQRRTRRLNRLLDDLLTYSRAGRSNGDIMLTDTRLMVRDIATLLAPPEGLVIEADASLPTFETYRAPLEQVLRNLIHNAIKHHPTGSGRIRVYAQQLDDEIMFAVEDDGAGIADEYAERVFKMFQTLQPRDEREGSGMGLAIVQRIVDWQGGRIWFHPGPDQVGTVFKFIWKKTIPACGMDEKGHFWNEADQDETRQHLAG